MMPALGAARFLPCLLVVAWCAPQDGTPDSSLGPRNVLLNDATNSSDEDLPRLKSHPIDGPFCANHFAGMSACSKCHSASVRRRSMQANGSSWNKAVLLYLHAQKTGGSTLECATQNNPLQSRWVNMGHTFNKVVDNCRNTCTVEGVKPKVVVMIRDVYDFWASRFLFAWECKFALSCARSFGIQTFHQFLRFVDKRYPGHHPIWMPQQLIMIQQCGNPCKYDFLLHTETMQENWLELMDKIGQPRTLLPRDVNPTKGMHPPIEFDTEALEIIRRIDGDMFDVWGQKERKEPFSLNANMTRLWQE